MGKPLVVVNGGKYSKCTLPADDEPGSLNWYLQLLDRSEDPDLVGLRFTVRPGEGSAHTHTHTHTHAQTHTTAVPPTYVDRPSLPV